MTALLERDELAPIRDTAIALARAGLAPPTTAVVIALSSVQRAAARGNTAALAAWACWSSGRVVELSSGTDPRVIELARYVRTQAGARRYKQPIGSLITAKGGRKSRALPTSEIVKRATARRDKLQLKGWQAALKLGTMDRKSAATGLGRLKQHQLYAVRREARGSVKEGGIYAPGAYKQHNIEMRRAADHVDRELARRADARVKGMDDDALDVAMRRSIERNRLTEFDRYAAEETRRNTAKEKAADRSAAAKAAREKAAAEREAAQFAAYERLLSAGEDDENAVAQAYGVPVEKQRAQAALAAFRADGHQGKGLQEAGRAAFKAEVRERYVAAEDETRGHMLNSAGRAAGIDPAALFTDSDARARKYASDELLAWWDENGRPTFDEFLAERLDPAGARRFRGARGDYLQ